MIPYVQFTRDIQALYTWYLSRRVGLPRLGPRANPYASAPINPTGCTATAVTALSFDRFTMLMAIRPPLQNSCDLAFPRHPGMTAYGSEPPN